MLVGGWMADGVYLMNDAIGFCEEEEVFFREPGFIRVRL
jgi:hypothetical protein